VLPHLDAAYNLARWLTRNDVDAEDVVQDSFVRALRYFSGFRGGNARAWLLTIVRHTCYRSMRTNGIFDEFTEFDEETHRGLPEGPDPETMLIYRADSKMLESAMNELPVRLREVLVLRECEGLSYREIADVAGIPIGTVMSSLSRGRQRLRQILLDVAKLQRAFDSDSSGAPTRQPSSDSRR
jgi:RNA polymerase sigma-70 factor (ECF subfamily)